MLDNFFFQNEQRSTEEYEGAGPTSINSTLIKPDIVMHTCNKHLYFSKFQKFHSS